MAWSARDLLLVALLTTGCVVPGAAVDALEQAEAASAAAPPGLLEAPRLLRVPAGDSDTVIWLNATEADWVEIDGEDWLLRGFEMTEDADMDAFAVVWLTVENGRVSVTGTHLGQGGRAGGTGITDGPRDVTALAILHVVGAAAPFEMRFGAQEEMFDFELEGEGVPAEVVSQGDRGDFAWFFEFGSPFGALFGGEPLNTGFEREDSRATLRGSAAGAAGSLSLAFEHPVAGPSLHEFSALAFTFLGERVGRWTVEHTTDGETFSDGGVLLTDPASAPWVIVDSAPAGSAAGAYRLDIAAEVMPITSVHAITTPFDAVALGLTVETAAQRYGGLPVIVGEGGCVDLARPRSPTAAACRMTEP